MSLASSPFPMGPGHFLQPDCGGRCIVCRSLTAQLWMPPPGGYAECSLHSPWSNADHHLHLLSHFCILAHCISSLLLFFQIPPSRLIYKWSPLYITLSSHCFFFFTKSSYYSLFCNLKALCIWVLDNFPQVVWKLINLYWSPARFRNSVLKGKSLDSNIVACPVPNTEVLCYQSSSCLWFTMSNNTKVFPPAPLPNPSPCHSFISSMRT